MLTIVESYRAGLFKLKNLLPNVIAGVIVGVVALPIAMAFAIASGAKPEQGIYTAIIAALVVGVCGGSRVQIAGPTGAFIIILANITAQYGISGLQVASLMAGFMLLLMGFAKLGSVIKFIPSPVIVGFTSGIGVIIFVGEWRDFFGLPVHLALNAPFHQKLFLLTTALSHLHLATTGLALLSVLLIYLTPKIVKRVPGPLVAMVVITILQYFFHFDGVATLGSAFGGIPQHLPQLQIPEINFNKILALIGPAFTIALLGAIESLLSAAAADGLAGTKHDSNQELIGQGLANIFTPLFGGFAATGAIARSATNVRNGGNSPLAAIVHSCLLLLVLVLLAPIANFVPLCVLAAILVVVAYNMSDIPHFIRLFKVAPWYDVFILISTFLLTVFANLVIAVNVGVILAMLFFIRRMNQVADVEQYSLQTVPGDLTVDISATQLPKDTLIYNIQGPLFFGVAEKIEHALAETHTDPLAIIFRLKDIPFMDITGLEIFHELILRYHKRNVAIYLCEANNKVKEKLLRAKILPFVVGGKIFNTFAEII